VKQTRREERWIIKDHVISGLIDKLNTILDAAYAHYDTTIYAEAYLLFQQALEQCQAIIKTCESRKKLAYVAKLKNLLADIAHDLAYSAFMLKKIQEAIKYATLALTNPNKKMLAATLLATIHNNTHNYCEEIKYLEMEDLYKKFAVSAVYDAAICLRAGSNGVKKDSKHSLKYFRVVAARRNTDLDFCALLSEAELYEVIAQVCEECADTKNELSWRLKAVAFDHPVALHNYATMLANGEGMKADEQLALEYHLKAATLGHATAMNDAAVIIMNKKNISEASEKGLALAEALLTAAADQHDNVIAMVNLGGLLYDKNDHDIKTVERIEKYCARGELEHNREARNLRASIIMRECLANNQNLDDAIEIYQELALSGLGSAQYNLAVIFHTLKKGSPSAAIYWYLEAISNGYNFAKDNLLILVFSIATKMPDAPQEILKLFQSTLSQYKRMLPKKLWDSDPYIVTYETLIAELSNGLKGEISELFKKLFPSLHLEMHCDIVAVNHQISQMAHITRLEPAEKVRIILEFAQSSAISTRNRTSAIKDIAQIVAWERHGATALIENRDLIGHLLTKIAEGTLDNEGFVELCVGLAKFKGHPESRLFKPCYDKLLLQLQDPSFLLTLKLTPSSLTTLLACSSEFAAEKPLTRALIMFCAEIYRNIMPDLKPFQLFRCLQSTCINHASFTDPNINRTLKAMVEDFCHTLSRINPNRHSPIDLYQGYLSILYMKRNRVIDSGLIQAVELNFKNVFPPMLAWFQGRKGIDIHSSKSQQQLANFLKRYRPDVEEEVFKHGLFVDIYLRSSKMIVDFDGPPHFLVCMPDEDPPRIRRRKDTFHDKIHGLKVLRVVYEDWDQYKNDAARLAFLKNKLLPYGIQLEDVTELIQTKEKISATEQSRPK
jgi:TPR repeat protein